MQGTLVGETFVCTRCGYFTITGKKEHKCRTRRSGYSFYNDRYIKCNSCPFKEKLSCGVSGERIEFILEDFEARCPKNFWSPIIFECEACHLLVADVTGNGICPECDTVNFIKKEFVAEKFPEKKSTETEAEIAQTEKKHQELLKKSLLGTKTVFHKGDIDLDESITNSPNRELIVSLYQENIDWLNHIPENIDMITIYDKGYRKEEIDLIPDNRIRVISLPNIGREAHTWLYHIISRWNSLANVTFLAQGDPFEHSPFFLELISLDNDYYNHFCTLTTHYKINGPDPWPKQEDSIKPINKVIQIYEYKVNLCINNTNLYKLYGPYWHKVFDCNLPKEFLHGYGAMYALPKQTILQRPNIFYKNILTLLLSAHTLECLWFYIFSDPKKYPSSLNDN